MRTREATAIIVGTNLGACRVLRRAGVQVVLVHDDDLPEPPPRWVNFRLCPSYAAHGRDPAWLASMLALASEFGPRPILFPASDAALLATAAHEAELGDAYRLACAPGATLQLLIDKVGFARFAMAHELPIPASHVVASADDLARVLPLAPLPCIVKPSLTFELEAQAGTKLFRARTRDEIAQGARQLLALGMTVVLQEDLSVGQSIQWSLCGLAQGGELIEAVLSQKLRQVEWGAGTAVETLPMDPHILEVGRRLCRALDLTGIFELELRPDATGAPRIIEINPRIWAQVRLPTVAGKDLLYHAYLQAAGLPVVVGGEYRTGVGWTRWRRDLRVCASLLRRGELSLATLCISLSHIRVIE